MKLKTILILTFFMILMTALHAQNQNEANASSTIPLISKPPDSLKLDPFYVKYINANGFPIISSWRTPDKALIAAYNTIMALTQSLPPAVLNKMRETIVKIGVMARYEGTTDIPEHRYLANDTSMNWDVRARGLGATPELPLTTCAEENLLCYQLDKYHAEDILVHEFAHAIHLVGIVGVKPQINEQLQKALDNALAAGKWVNTYAATNFEEYWAEGVQSWFNVNGEVKEADGKHNHVNTREELKVYDPALYKILDEYFDENVKCTSCHSNSNQFTE